MNEEKEINEQEGLRIITQMIEAAKQDQRDDGKGWIIWGWLLFLASMFTYVNLKTDWLDPFFFWNLFGLASFGLLLYESIKNRRHAPATEGIYIKSIFRKLNAGFGISLVLIIASMNIDVLSVYPQKGFSLLLVLYGFWILIYGALLNFRPSIIGAYVTWAFALAGMFVEDFSITMLIHAGAVLCGYIIPGHMAFKEFNRLYPKENRVQRA